MIADAATRKKFKFPECGAAGKSKDGVRIAESVGVEMCASLFVQVRLFFDRGFCGESIMPAQPPASLWSLNLVKAKIRKVNTMTSSQKYNHSAP